MRLASGGLWATNPPPKREESLNGRQADDLYEDTGRKPGEDLRQTDAQDTQTPRGKRGPQGRRQAAPGSRGWDVVYGTWEPEEEMETCKGAPNSQESGTEDPPTEGERPQPWLPDLTGARARLGSMHWTLGTCARFS